MSTGMAIHSEARAIVPHRDGPPRRKVVHRKDEQVSVTVVLFFTLASTAISVYDLVLLFKVLMM